MYCQLFLNRHCMVGFFIFTSHWTSKSCPQCICKLLSKVTNSMNSLCLLVTPNWESHARHYHLLPFPASSSSSTSNLVKTIQDWKHLNNKYAPSWFQIKYIANKRGTKLLEGLQNYYRIERNALVTGRNASFKCRICINKQGKCFFFKLTLTKLSKMIPWLDQAWHFLHQSCRKSSHTTIIILPLHSTNSSGKVCIPKTTCGIMYYHIDFL